MTIWGKYFGRIDLIDQKWGPNIMKSQSIVEYGAALQETTAETPELSGTEVLVRVHHCGVCHSDIHLQDGYFDMGGGNKLDVSRGRKLPFTLGHEIEGELIALGPDADASGLEIGKRYAVFPWGGCGNCPICARGDEHLCNAPKHLGVSINGGFSDYVVVPDAKYLLDYSGISEDLAGSYMCSGLTAFSALKKLGTVGAGETVAIVGLGGVGMMGLEFARALFPEARLIAADIDERKLDAAKKAGADEVYNTKEDGIVKRVLKESGGGVYGSVDFVGAEASLKFADGIIRKGGKVVVVGMFGGSYSTSIPLIPMRASYLIGSFVGSLPETLEMLDLVKSGKINPIPVEVRELDQANKTLEDLREGKIVGRVVLKV